MGHRRSQLTFPVKELYEGTAQIAAKISFKGDEPVTAAVKLCRGQPFLGLFRDEVPFYLGEESEQGDDHLGLKVLFTLEADAFLDGREVDLALHQTVR